MENNNDSRNQGASDKNEDAVANLTQDERHKELLEKVKEQAKKEWLERNLYCEFDKSYICPLKALITYELHLAVRPEYMGCQFCSYLYDLGVKHKETIGGYKFGSAQQEILDELQLCVSLPEEKKIADPGFSKKTNLIRKQAARELQKRKLALARKRPEPDPTNPNHWTETTRATLTALGAIVTNRISQKAQDVSRLLLKDPVETIIWYWTFLTEGKKFLLSAIPALQKRHSKKPKREKEESLQRGKHILDELPQTLIEMVREIETIEYYLRGEPLPENAYQATDLDAIPEKMR